MNIKDIYMQLTKYAPIELSETFCRIEDCHDNSGVILSTDDDIDKILFSLDLTKEAASFAAKEGYKLIVTHHPAIYYPILSITPETEKPLYICAQNRIGVISMHLNYDSTDFGIDYYLAEGLGAREQKILTCFGGNTGYGRTFEVDSATAEEIKNRYVKEFGTDKVFIFGDKNKIIKRISSFCGGGADDKAIELSAGSDMIVSADFKHHIILKALERGFTVMQITHYGSEYYGHRKIAANLQKKLENIKIYFLTDKRFL